MYPAEIGAENINLLFPNNSPSTADLVTVRYIQQAAVDSGYFKSMDSIENGEEQINPGDVLIIRYPGKNTGHTGLVVQCDEDYIYTVEGNANQAVRLKKYPRSILRDYNFAGFIDMNRLYSGGNDYVIPECSIPEYLFVDVTSGESRTR